MFGDRIRFHTHNLCPPQVNIYMPAILRDDIQVGIGFNHKTFKQKRRLSPWTVKLTNEHSLAQIANTQLDYFVMDRIPGDGFQIDAPGYCLMFMVDSIADVSSFYPVPLKPPTPHRWCRRP